MNLNSFSFIILLLISAGCYHLRERTSSLNAPVKFLAVDTAIISDSPLQMYASVNKFYETHHYLLAWVDTSGLTPAGDSLMSFIRSSAMYGLIPDDYHLKELHQLEQSPKTNGNLIKSDILLTDNFFCVATSPQIWKN